MDASGDHNGVVPPIRRSPRRHNAETVHEENKTIPEDIGADALCRGEGRGEGKDFDGEEEENVTAIKPENIDEKTAQVDQGERPSSPEDEEEKEDGDSHNKDYENKTQTEDIGAGALCRGEGRGEGKDFDGEEEENVTAIEPENVDEKTAETVQEENKEEKEEDCDSSNKDEENKTIPEDTGAEALDRAARKAPLNTPAKILPCPFTLQGKERSAGGKGPGWMAGAVGAVILSVLVCYVYVGSASPPEHKDVPRRVIFLRELETVKTQFPGQRSELWRRSRIHLEKHLQTAQPTEPVSLILTAGRGAERTLHCLAQRLASSFSTALNASVLHIDGASKARQDSDQVKLDIDSQLRGAFGGDKPVAVIHRFEELPPGSTLIFYRYCDHENAAYKKTFLIFTVLLGEEEELPAQLGLSAVEEMVDDHLQRRFLSSDHHTAFDRMDLDKYSGLWSRISHLILPVAAERRIQHHGGC